MARTLPAHDLTRPAVPPRVHARVLAGLLLLSLALLADVLLSPANDVAAHWFSDVYLLFGPMREFGFGQLRQGNLALWNPYNYSGQPFFGNFQSALLYPLNALFLALPLAAAINASYALHLFLAGAAMYGWGLGRGLHPFAAAVAAVLYMGCGANFPHFYAGHLTIVSFIPWAPLLLLAIDANFLRPNPRMTLVGAFATAMMIFAGYPQYLFFTAVAASLYSLLLLFTAPRRPAFLLTLLAMAGGGALLGAVQLLAGWHAAAETLRGAGASFEFVSVFSLPPENLITLLAPFFFGDMQRQPYWGRCAYWEMTLFFGVAGLVLAAIGAARGDPRLRRFSLPMAILLILLAFGSHTPLLRLLYDHVPGFQGFRGMSKFIFPASLFLIMLAAVGLDHLLRAGELPRRWRAAVPAAGLCLLAAGAALALVAAWRPEWLIPALRALHATGDVYHPLAALIDPDPLRRAASFAAGSLIVAAATLLAVGWLLARAPRHRAALFALGTLAMAEVILFAALTRARSDLDQLHEPRIARTVRRHPGDHRFLTARPSLGMSFHARDAWGIDSYLPRRYAEFIAVSQGGSPETADRLWITIHDAPLLGLLRVRFVSDDAGNLHPAPRPEGRLMPRASLIERFELVADRDAILARLQDPDFDWSRSVILERPPVPPPTAPAGDSPGTVTLVDLSTDELEIRAALHRPALLLLTDSYSRGWRARNLATTPPAQPRYELLTADYCLQAIPLAAGRHHFILEYRPRAFRVGAALSLASWTGLAGLCLLLFLRRRRDGSGASSPIPEPLTEKQAR